MERRVGGDEKWVERARRYHSEEENRKLGDTNYKITNYLTSPNLAASSAGYV